LGCRRDPLPWSDLAFRSNEDVQRIEICAKDLLHGTDEGAMLVLLCLVLVPLLAAGDGYEDEHVFKRQETHIEAESTAYKVSPATSGLPIRIRVRSSDVPLPLILSM
jgi:hypothetical protein